MSKFREIPSIEQLRQRDSVRALETTYGRAAVIDALRAEAAAVRAHLAAVTDPIDPGAAIEAGVAARLESMIQPSLRSVINASGVIVHTNLGRAPLCRLAAARVAELAAGYTNLEYDLDRGSRGRRDLHAERLLCRLTGATAAVVVNNNAAAALISLAALADGREVLISRGELVEIGGGFRVPDVMAQSGAILREVGTTNRTRIGDYAAAISDRTALILRVHPSNFRIEGFTERPPLRDLVDLGRRFNVVTMEDLGSGYLGVPGGIESLRDEPDVRASVAAGVDLVTFSGDKLLGGPQAGIVVGTEATVSQTRRHPLMRALRVDKMTYAALEATLEEYMAGRANESVPVAAMIVIPIAEIDSRAARLAEAVRTTDLAADVIDGYSTIGGGSAPGSALPTRLVSLAHRRFSADVLEATLRAERPPLITRIEHDRVLLDLRTVPPDQDDLVAQLIRTATGTLERT